MSVQALYVHVPFCTGKCFYCAFHSGIRQRPISEYLNSIDAEFQARGNDMGRITSIYFGGGTPALLESDGFEKFAELFLNKISLEDNYEWTVEVHPAAVDRKFFKTLKDIGVNRISIGVQSWNNETLKRCNRRHTTEQAENAVETALEFFPNTGIDLIAGLPDVTEAEWEKTVEKTCSFNLKHISVYSLSIEPNSVWENLTPPNDDLVMDAIATAEEILKGNGIFRYEISNYSRPDFECKHNVACWNGKDFLGIGDGAHSRIGLTRFPDENVTPEEDALERSLTMLRLQNNNFDIEKIITNHPALKNYKDLWVKKIADFNKAGLFKNNSPTRRGYEVFDAIMCEMLRKH